MCRKLKTFTKVNCNWKKKTMLCDLELFLLNVNYSFNWEDNPEMIIIRLFPGYVLACSWMAVLLVIYSLKLLCEKFLQIAPNFIGSISFKFS